MSSYNFCASLIFCCNSCIANSWSWSIVCCCNSNASYPAFCWIYSKSRFLASSKSCKLVFRVSMFNWAWATLLSKSSVEILARTWSFLTVSHTFTYTAVTFHWVIKVNFWESANWVVHCNVKTFSKFPVWTVASIS